MGVRSTPFTPAWQRPEPGAIQIDGVAGAVVEVKDPESTRAFYDRLFAGRGGRWEAERRRLRYRDGAQTIEFVRTARPRTLSDHGAHHAYRVERGRLRRLLEGLSADGHEISWWREDHPAERDVAAYVRDPSGNLLQLVGSAAGSYVLDHSAVVVEDLEEGELVYVNALGGALDFYHGWKTADVLGAREVWAAGDDPCAPWTRRATVSFRSHRPEPNPIPQVFARYGEAIVAVVLTDKRIVEPPEEVLRGTPRLVLHSSQPVDEVARYLEGVRVSAVALAYDGGRIPFEREGADLFFRDRSGNFLQITCDG